MTHVLKVLGLVGHQVSGQEAATGYVVSSDVDAHNGLGELVVSDDIGKAMKFPNSYAAMAYWSRQSVLQPLRPDGKPNRPLTAYTTEVVEVE